MMIAILNPDMLALVIVRFLIETFKHKANRSKGITSQLNLIHSGPLAWYGFRLINCDTLIRTFKIPRIILNSSI